MLQVFVGMDQRQPVAFTVLQTSIMARCSSPVAVTALLIDHLPIKRRGLTEFTFTRYLVPFLMGYKGRALFMDADMLCLGDLNELFGLADDKYAVQVVKNDLRFEWPSLMLFNCERCAELTPEFIETESPHNLNWGPVGDLPREWNRAVGYEDCSDAKILHYTMGIPAFPETQVFGGVEEWKESLRAACATVSWADLMGNSVHAEAVRKANEAVASHNVVKADDPSPAVA